MRRRHIVSAVWRIGLGGEVSITGEVITGPTLAELRESVNREHEGARLHAALVLEHVIRAGEILLVARKQCPPGKWKDWTAGLDFGHVMASHYMRVAEHKAIVLDGVGADASLGKAIRYLRAVGASRHTESGVRKYSEGTRLEVERLATTGLSNRKIGLLLDVPSKSVWGILNPGKVASQNVRNRERRLAKKRAAENRRYKRNALALGGAISELYSIAERVQDLLAQAQRETNDPEAREALSRAGKPYRAMRDEIVRALGAT